MTSSEITTVVETITPQTAKHWLDTANTHNRKVREQKVASYARDMLNGLWETNGDAIRFATDGTLLDGQHRLLACVRSGIDLCTVVVRGLSRGTQDTMDAGAARTAGDILTLHSEVDAHRLAAVARRVMRFRHGLVATGGGTYMPTNPEIRQFVVANPSIRRAAGIASRAAKTVPASPACIGAAYFLCAERSVPDAEHFFVTQLIECIGLREGDPARSLLRRFQHDATVKGRQIAPEDAFRFALTAWNHYRAGRQIAKLQAPKGGWTSTNTPVPN